MADEGDFLDLQTDVAKAYADEAYHIFANSDTVSEEHNESMRHPVPIWRLLKNIDDYLEPNEVILRECLFKETQFSYDGDAHIQPLFLGPKRKQDNKKPKLAVGRGAGHSENYAREKRDQNMCGYGAHVQRIRFCQRAQIRLFCQQWEGRAVGGTQVPRNG